MLTPGDSLERIVPDQVRLGELTGEEALRLHLERYEFAAKHAQAGRLLDIACGAGYGTRLLTDRGAGEILALGVDRSAEAIDYAERRYGNDRTRFITGDAMEFSDADGFDTIVSLETIEHLRDPAGFLAGLVRMLPPEGTLVASVPVTPTVDADPYHLYDFNERSFRRIFAPHGLVELDTLVQVQPFKLGAVFRRKEARMKQLRANLPAYYLSHPTALGRRLWSTLRHGLVTRYLTIAWRGVRLSQTTSH